MPEIYRALVEMRPVIFKPSEVTAVPGGIIMQRIVGPAELGSLFTSFCQYFGANNRWTWTGGAVTPSGAAILDGAAVTGQCLALARALRLLITMRKPYGLGYSENQVGDPHGPGQYQGRYGQGFISSHGGVHATTVLGLRSNVFDTSHADIQQCNRLPLYSWGNHKVVPYKGRYYDPSYHKIYRKLSEMASYHVRAEGIARRVTLQGGKQVRQEFTHAESPSGSPVYFRELDPPEFQLVGASAGALQGPYQSLPGERWS